MANDWTSLTSLSVARSQASFTGQGGTLYLAGAAVASATTMWSFPLPTGPWVEGSLTPAAFAEVNGASAWVNGELHILTYDGTGTGSLAVTPRKWNPSTGWSAGTAHTISRPYRCAGAYLNGKFYIVGKNVHVSYDPFTGAGGTWADPFTTVARPGSDHEYPVVVAFQDALQVIGGNPNVETTFDTTDAHHSYYPDVPNTWTTQPVFAGGVRSHMIGAAAGDAAMFVGFGTDVTGLKNDFWMWDGTSWTSKASPGDTDAGLDGRLTVHRQAVYAWNLGGQQLKRWNPDIHIPPDSDQTLMGWGIPL